MENGDVIFFLHPQTIENLDMTPRDRWRMQQRTKRMIKGDRMGGQFSPVFAPLDCLWQGLRWS